jgi:hypothetical protein
MKIVFKIIFAAAAFVAVQAACLEGSAHAQSVYVSTRDLLSDFFKKSQNVTYQTVTLSAQDRERLAKKLGYAPGKASYTFFVATSGSHVDGYALIDEEKGEHLPITFAVKLSADGVVERQEIVAYREPRGDEVRAECFRKQFVGKSAHDPISAGQDIIAISGATISSRAMAVGVRRAVVLFEEMIKPTRLVSAGGRPAGSL